MAAVVGPHLAATSLAMPSSVAAASGGGDPLESAEVAANREPFRGSCGGSIAASPLPHFAGPFLGPADHARDGPLVAVIQTASSVHRPRSSSASTSGRYHHHRSCPSWPFVVVAAFASVAAACAASAVASPSHPSSCPLAQVAGVATCPCP